MTPGPPSGGDSLEPSAAMTAPSILPKREAATGGHPVVIGGMHRSGTSLLASLFEGSGVAVGERLMGSGAGNAAGHFEDLDFYEFHQRALASNGLSADGFTADGLPVVPDSMRAEAASLIARRRAGGGMWGWKDPRTVLFLDFWSELLPEARYVFVFRSPGEVVDSFFRRGDPAFVFHPLLAARVWLHYNRRILAFLARHPDRCLIRETTQITADPRELFATIRDRLGLPVGEPPQRFRPELLGHDADGRRTRLVAEACPEAMAVYVELCSRAGFPAPRPAGDGPTAAETAIIEWSRAARFERENADVRRHWVELRAAADAEAAALRARLAAWEAVASDIQSALAAIDGVETRCAKRLVALRETTPVPRGEAA